MDLITAQQTLTDTNWQIIKKIFLTVGVISPKLAKKILWLATKSYPLDRNMLVDINEVIIKNKLTDLSEVSADVLTAFKPFTDSAPSSVPRVIRSFIPLNIHKTISDNRFTNKQRNGATNTYNTLDDQSNVQRCDFITRTITTTYDSNGSSDNSIPSVVTSSTSSRASSMSYDNQYLPQQVFPVIR